MIKEGIKIADEIRGIYTGAGDNVLQWKNYGEIFDHMYKHRDEFSTKSSGIIDAVKANLMKGMNTYFTATKNIYEWAETVASQLNDYVKLIDEHKQEQADAQKDQLLQKLTEGSAKIKEVQAQMKESATILNTAAGQLTKLKARFDKEFDEHSDYFQQKIKEIRIKGNVAGTYFSKTHV